MGALTVLLSDELLPPKYFNDSRTIVAIAQRQIVNSPDQQFEHVTRIYAFLGLVDYPVLTGLINYVAWVVVLVAAWRGVHAGGALALGWQAAVLILGAVFLGQFSKDVFVLGVVAVLVLAGRGRAREVAILLVMLAYAGWFRPYWFLVAGLYALGRLWIGSRGLSPRAVVMLLGAQLLVVVSAVHWGLGVDFAHFREAANAARIGSVDAQTALPASFLQSEQLPVDYLNALLFLLDFMLPASLAVSGGPFYLVIAGTIAALWLVFWLALIKGRHASVTDVRLLRAVALVTSFVAVQTAFEPDYGSYLRHITPLLPLLLMVALWDRRKSA